MPAISATFEFPIFGLSFTGFREGKKEVVGSVKEKQDKERKQATSLAIREGMREKHWTTYKLAQMMGLSYPAVRKWVKAISEPEEQHKNKLTLLFGWPIDVRIAGFLRPQYVTQGTGVTANVAGQIVTEKGLPESDKFKPHRRQQIPEERVVSPKVLLKRRQPESEIVGVELSEDYPNLGWKRGDVLFVERVGWDHVNDKDVIIVDVADPSSEKKQDFRIKRFFAEKRRLGSLNGLMDQIDLNSHPDLLGWVMGLDRAEL